MSTGVTIDLDDDLLAAYRLAALVNERSLEAELRETLAAQRPRRRMSPEERVRLSEQVRAQTPEASAKIDSTALIREDRDAR